MKKLMSLFLAVTIVFSVCTMVLAQEQSYDQLESAITQLPDHSAFADGNAQGFDEAFAQVESVVFDLISLKEYEMLSVTGYEDAILTYIQFVDVKLRTGLPTQVPTSQTYWQDYAWYQQAMAALEEYWYLDELCVYTKTAQRPFIAQRTTEGGLIWGDLQNDIYDISIRLAAYETMLTDEETAARIRQQFNNELSRYPTPTDVETYWEYALDFDEFQRYTDYQFRPYTYEILDPADYQQYLALRELYLDFPQNHEDDLYIALDEMIMTSCDFQALHGVSRLMRRIISNEVMTDIERKISHLYSAYGYYDRVIASIGNYDLFGQYRDAVYAADVVYGDITGDGKVDAGDALWALQAAVGKLDLYEGEKLTADVDGSGTVDAVDALYILQYAVEKRYYFPVEFDTAYNVYYF